MNATRREMLIHDKQAIKSFWERKIESHTQLAKKEEVRVKKSALKKLRNEWVERLENRTRQLQNYNEETNISAFNRSIR
ncbi:F240A protein, partial [Polypterus senegalus]